MTDPSPFSRREQEVVRLVLEGQSNKLIASALKISVSTVEFHLKNIYAKLGVASRVELMVKLRESVVAGDAELADNRETQPQVGWVNSLRELLSKIGKEIKMEQANTGTVTPDTPMPFFESIRTCLAKYAEFHGRASRPEFWWFALFVTLVASALTLIHETLGEIFLIGMALPLLAAGTRRLRDSGKSGWLTLYILVPVGGIILLGILWAAPSVNPQSQEDSPA